MDLPSFCHNYSPHPPAQGSGYFRVRGVAERKGGGMSEIFSRRSIRYSVSVLVTFKVSSDFSLYKRSRQMFSPRDRGEIPIRISSNRCDLHQNLLDGPFSKVTAGCKVAAPNASHRMCSLIGFRKSIPPQNYQIIVHYYFHMR